MLYSFNENNRQSTRTLDVYTSNFELFSSTFSIDKVHKKKPVSDIDLVTIKLGVTSRYAVRVLLTLERSNVSYMSAFQLLYNNRTLIEIALDSIFMNKSYDIKIYNSINKISCKLIKDNVIMKDLNLPTSYYIARAYKPFVKDFCKDEEILINITSIFKPNETDASFNI